MIQVNQELCAGCGVCADACSEGAIQLVEHRAVIDSALCIHCETCLEVCPNGALYSTVTVEPALERNSAVIETPVLKINPVPPINQTNPSVSMSPARGIKPLVRATLAFLGSEVAPRLVDVFLTTLERKLTRPADTIVNPLPASSGGFTTQRKGKRRQIRSRQRRTSAETNIAGDEDLLRQTICRNPNKSIWHSRRSMRNQE